MKTVPAIAALMLLASLLVTACGNANGAPASAIPVPTSGDTLAESNPSYGALVRDGFFDPSIPRITAEDLKRQLDSGREMIIIDNRRDSKFRWGHVPGAINITYAVDSPYPGEEEAMDRELAALPNDALKILYCD